MIRAPTPIVVGFLMVASVRSAAETDTVPDSPASGKRAAQSLGQAAETAWNCIKNQ
jgi:hypothetical protein